MTSYKRALLAVIGVALFVIACHTPTHTGRGAIKAMTLRPDLKPVGLYVSPGEEYLVVQTAAPGRFAWGTAAPRWRFGEHTLST